MTVVWLLIFGVLAGAALLCELAVHMSADLFGTSRRENTLKEEIGKLHHDLTTAEKKIGGLKDALRASGTQMEATRQDLTRLERDLNQKKRVPPVLVFRIGPPSPTQLRYRAPLSKQLPAEPEPTQALIWRTACVVETWASSPRQALQHGSQQFRAELGYTVGAFVRRDEPA